MTSVTASLPGFPAPRDTGQRLTLSLALSVAAHLVVIAMLAGLLKPLLTPVLGRVGQALPIEVAIVGVRPIAFTAPPEAPAPASELPMAPQRPGSAPALRPAPPLSPPDAEVPAQPFGVSVQADVNAETLSADAPPPPGDVSVGAIIDSERLGHAQALRLAQRFPRTAAKPPRLREPLIVPYPPRAARGDGFAARVEAHAVHAVNVQIAEKRIAPAAEGVKRHGHRNRHVDSHHADFDILLKPSCRIARASEKRGAIGVGIGVDHRDRIIQRIRAHHNQHRAEYLLAVNRHLRGRVIEQRRSDKEPGIMARDRRRSAVDDQRCAFRDAPVDAPNDTVLRGAGNDRTHFRFGSIPGPGGYAAR